MNTLTYFQKYIILYVPEFGKHKDFADLLLIRLLQLATRGQKVKPLKPQEDRGSLLWNICHSQYFKRYCNRQLIIGCIINTLVEFYKNSNIDNLNKLVIQQLDACNNESIDLW